MTPPTLQADTKAPELPSTHAGARHFCLLAKGRNLLTEHPRGLVAGCGLGHEAAYIQESLGASIVGIDPEVDRNQVCSGFEFHPASVLDIPAADASFDFVFYHHVIEHVPDADKSLAEISRVLKSGGWMYLGTPNRHRILGYVGSHTASLKNKVVWNAQDYWARLRFRFRNEHGAHAGFSKKELGLMMDKYFSETEWLTRDYLIFKFGQRMPKSVLSLATAPLIMDIAAPAIYALGRKE
jgi:SAM-dependent methyltransferase